MVTRRAPRKKPPSIGSTLRYYAIMAIYIVIAMVIMYFLIQWAMGQIVDASVNVLKATPTPRYAVVSLRDMLEGAVSEEEETWERRNRHMTPKAGDTRKTTRPYEGWPKLKVRPEATMMNADILRPDIARLVGLIEGYPASRNVILSKIELEGRYDSKTDTGELMLLLYSSLSAEAAAEYQQQLEDVPEKEWEAELSDYALMRLADWSFGLVVLPLGARNPSDL